jgi:excisionase family DNA binding protein
MSESAVEQLDTLIEEIVHELNGIRVRYRSVGELAPMDQGILIGQLQPLLLAARTVREEIDAKHSLILDMKLAVGAKPFLTVAEFAALVGKSERQIQWLVEAGRIPSKPSRGRSVKIPVEAAETFSKKDDDDEETGRRS